MPTFLNEYTMYFHGRTEPTTYGELVSWDDDKDAFEHMMSGVGMHPGNGLHALEIQHGILDFLVKFCKLLLRDIPSLTEGDVLLDPGPPTDVLKEAGLTSLEVTSMGAQYDVPSKLDFTRLKALLAAKRNAREDHAWALREDPSYFAGTVHDFAEHRQESIPDTNGHTHSNLQEEGQPLFWNRVLGSVVWDALFGLATFDEIYKQVEALEHTYVKYRDELRPDQDIPSELMDAFQEVRFTLYGRVKDIVESIRGGIIASPPMQGFCTRQPQDLFGMLRAGFEPSKATKTAKNVMALFNNLFNEQDLNQITLHTLTDELGRLFRSDAKANSLISSYVASRLSSLSIVAECLINFTFSSHGLRKLRAAWSKTKAKHYANTNRRSATGLH